MSIQTQRGSTLSRVQPSHFHPHQTQLKHTRELDFYSFYRMHLDLTYDALKEVANMAMVITGPPRPLPGAMQLSAI